jgi:riboflavin kinase, archaea type
MLDCQTVLPPYEPAFLAELGVFGAEVLGGLDQQELAWRLNEMPNASVQVAREGQLVGFKVGYAVARSRYHSWLGGVRAGWRRRGIALQLMEKQHAWLRTQGFTSVETAVVPANAAMLMLNLRVGFRVIGSYSRGDYLRVTLAKELARAGVVLRGIVRSGQGDFGFWLEKLQGSYQAKTGMKLFPGTLNLELAEPFRVPDQAQRLEAAEYGGTVSVSIIPCRVLGRSAFILRTDANEQGRGHHPRTIIEVATDVKLRDAHGLRDGDVVEVELAAEGDGVPDADQ